MSHPDNRRPHVHLTRRALLYRGAFAAGGLALAACGSTTVSTSTVPTSPQPSTLASTAPSASQVASAAPSASQAASAAPAASAGATATRAAGTPVASPAASAATGSSPAVSVKPGGTLRIATDMTLLNTISRGADAGVLGNFFHGRLLIYDTNARDLHPVLAEKWQASPDGKILTVTLREGAKWHDGTPFTTKDIEFTVKAYVHKDTAATSFGSSTLGGLVGAADFREGKSNALPGMRILNDRTFELEWANPNALMFFGMWITIPMPAHILGNTPYKDLLNHPFWQNPIGLGPFKFVKLVADQYAEFARNDDYVLGKPALDRILHVYYKDVETRVLALEKGEVDWVAATGSAYQRARKIANVNTIGGSFLNIQSLSVNMDKLPDKRIRQAMLHAIDRESIINTLYGDEVKLARSLVSDEAAWYNPSVPQYPFNPETAKQLLRSANWDGHEVDLMYYYSDQTSANMIAALQGFWEAVGIKSRPRLVTGPALVQELYEAHSYEVCYIGGPTFAPDPGYAGDQMHTKNFWPAGYNTARYANPEIDKLLDEGVSTIEFAKRIEIYRKIQALMMDDLPYIPLWAPNRYIFVNKQFCNIHFRSWDGGSSSNFPEKWGSCG